MEMTWFDKNFLGTAVEHKCDALTVGSEGQLA